ncbi:MAG: hypothetical protein VYA97_14990, partial [Pseudomonadota bacterium]|nr:hypothetical protein [Pseudomonadota bacterium]
MRRAIYTNDFNDFLGNGFSYDPIYGQLDLDQWTVTGFSAEDDLSRGETAGDVTTGGLYALNRGGEDGNALMIQPTGSDFTPGSLVLDLNSGDKALTDV